MYIWECISSYLSRTSDFEAIEIMEQFVGEQTNLYMILVTVLEPVLRVLMYATFWILFAHWYTVCWLWLSLD